tara:strand:- start:3830 stop:5257 length:1428 start_codon:yes stop_codon:yes gene_type:complete
MKPWFEKEAEVIPFPKKPEDNVIQMPNVQSYPDFLTGVQDLQSKLDKGKINKNVHAKLYSDLIARFAKKESADTPWFVKEVLNPQKANQAVDQLIANPKNMAIIQKIQNLSPQDRIVINKMINNRIQKKTTTGQMKKAIPQYEGALMKKVESYIRLRNDKDAINNSKLVIKAIMAAEEDRDVLVKWLKDFGKPVGKGGVDYIGADKILPEGGLLTKTNVKNLITDPIAMKVYNYINATVKTSKKNDAGPGEAAIAILCPFITLADSATEGGDLIFSTDGGKTGRPIEVKTDAGSIYPVTGKYQNYPNFKGEINDDYKAGKIATFGRKQTKDPNTGKMVTKVKGGVLTVDQYANFLDGVKQRTGTPLDKKGDQNYMKTEFMKKCTKAWFDEEVEIDTSSGAAFKKDWATKVFDYYKRMNGHEGILLVDKQGNYRYFVEGSQLAPEDLQLRSLYWTNQRGQSRGDKPGFKEVNKRKK